MREIYNDPDLRRRDVLHAVSHPLGLRAGGVPVPSATESISPTRLRGMYAIAIARPEARGRLVLARDPFGIKPLYYARDAGALSRSPPSRRR